MPFTHQRRQSFGGADSFPATFEGREGFAAYSSWLMKLSQCRAVEIDRAAIQPYSSALPLLNTTAPSSEPSEDSRRILLGDDATQEPLRKPAEELR